MMGVRAWLREIFAPKITVTYLNPPEIPPEVAQHMDAAFDEMDKAFAALRALATTKEQS